VEQLREVDISSATILVELFAHNTAATTAVAALLASPTRRDAMLLVMPADQRVDDLSAFFCRPVRLAAAEDGARSASRRSLPSSRPLTPFCSPTRPRRDIKTIVQRPRPANPDGDDFNIDAGQCSFKAVGTDAGRW
jgi:hypothetical protein